MMIFLVFRFGFFGGQVRVFSELQAITLCTQCEISRFQDFKLFFSHARNLDDKLFGGLDVGHHIVFR